MSKLPTASLLTFILLTSAACSSDEPGLGELPLATGHLDQSMTFLEVGESLSLDIELTEQNGSRADFRWIWDTAESDDFTLTSTTEKGLLHVEFTPLVPGRMHLSGRAEMARSGGRSDVLQIDVADIRAWGGTPSYPVPAHTRLSMVPGESRKTFALPMVEALGAPVYRTLGAGSIEYEIANPSIATVDANGEVLAIAPGSTSLSMTYGSETATIPVEVVAGEAHDPPTGHLVLDDDVADLIQRAQQHPSPDGRMAVDPQGWPVLAMIFEPFAGEANTSGEQVVVSRWTGSGFGLELISRPYDAAEEARLVIDETGALWSMYWSRFVRSKDLNDQVGAGDRSLVLASQSAADESSFRYHDLAHGLDQIEERDRVVGFGTASVLRARRDGGVWAVYTSKGTVRSPEDKQALCVDQLQLVEATADDLNSHLVFQREVDIQDDGECPDIEAPNPSGIDTMLDVLPRRSSDALPRIVSAHAWETDCNDYRCALPVYLFEPANGAFTRSNLLESFDFEDASMGNSFPYLNLSVARDTAAPFSEASILIGLDNVDLSSVFARTIVVRDAGATWFPSVQTEGIFGFRTQGHDFVSGRSLGTMSVVYPDGSAHHDPLHRGLRLPDELAFAVEAGPIIAWAASPNRLYLTQSRNSALHLYSSSIPEQTTRRDEEDESLGIRLGDGARTAVVHTPPLVFDSGKRVIIGRSRSYESRDGEETSNGAVMCSGGVNMPWSATEVTGTAAVDTLGSAIRHVGNTMYTMVGGQLYSSATGANWSTVGTPTLAADGWEIHPDGRFAGLRRSGTTWTLYTDSDIQNGFSPSAQASVSFGSEQPGLTFGRDGSIYLTRSVSNSLVTIEFEAGQAKTPVSIALPGGARGLPASVHVSANGDFVGAFVTSSSTGDPFAPINETLHIVHRAAGGSIATTPLGSIADSDHAQDNGINDFISLGLIRLSDNSLVVGWTSSERNTLRTRAVLASSGDGGKTWGTPIEIRPEGGGGQLFVGMAGEASGSVLAVISDNSAISGDISNATQLGVDMQGLHAPRMDDLVVRVDL